MKKSRIILCLIFLILSVSIYSQPDCHIRHYGLADGLPQRTVMSIIQDKKGFMWFSTWDGLCRFDGYNFISYKPSLSDSIFMSNNRIDEICEDKYGYLWITSSYNKEVFRFDPVKEKYVASFAFNNPSFITVKILPMVSGKVWLTSKEMGTICVLDSLNNAVYYNEENNKLKGNRVYHVLEDREQNSWILTNNGLVKVALDKDDFITFFTEDENPQDFFTSFEFNDEIWFGTNKGLIWIYNKQTAKFEAFDTGVNSDIISIKRIYEDIIIILTSNDGFLTCGKDKSNLKIYNRSNLSKLPTDKMQSCYIDKGKNVWLEVDSYGIAKFNFHERTLNFYTPLSANDRDMDFPPKSLILEDNEGNIWIHPKGGGFSFYDKTNDRLVPFYNDPHSSNYKFSNMLHDGYLDRQGNLWLGTRSNGLEKIIFSKNDFFNNPFHLYGRSLQKDEIRAVFEDKDKNIWMGSKNDTIYIFDSRKNFKGVLCEDGTVRKDGKLLKGPVYVFFQDKKGNIWIGTKGYGLYLLKKDVNNENKYRVVNFFNDPSDSYSLSNNNVYSVYEDPNGRIWIGTFGGGLNLYDQESGNFFNHNNQLNDFPMDIGFRIRKINGDNNGNIYIGTASGLLVFSSAFQSFDKIEYKTFISSPQQKEGIRSNNIFDIYVSENGDIYIATFGGGFSKVVEKDPEGFPLKFKTYSKNEGAYSDIILSIIQDDEGFLWVNSEGNLSRFDPENETFEVFSDINRIIENYFFSEAHPMITYLGEVIYGITNGILIFNPENMNKSTFKPYLALTKFRILNNDRTIENIDDIQTIELNNKENFFSIEYIALDFKNPQDITYFYKLDGFDEDWIFNHKQRVVNYTNLAPGNYVFRIKSTDSNGNWIENEHVLNIVIHPSFWQTNWAYILYIVLFLLILFIIFRSLFVFYRMRDKVVLEQEQMEMKTRFFTDISHEIRTPLTMIVSPVENILENNQLPSDVKPQLELVLKNTNRMLNMVNQILDFRKIQKKKLILSEIPLGEFTMEICDHFIKSMENRSVLFKTDNRIGSDEIWGDRDSIEKLIYNLIANAVKYTHPEKTIEINVFRKDKTIALQVKDEGKGMTKDILNKLFTRFVSFNSDKSKPSTGIGLSIVKEVADRHHAKITVDSELDKGSVFTVFFQSGFEHFSQDQNVGKIINNQKEEILSENQDPDKIINQDQENLQASILIVEDDPDLRNFMKLLLKSYYNVYEAGNGAEGYDNVIKYMPDFILSDIMMPEKDGIELLKNVRSNYETSHIPFILLTAKTSNDDILRGIAAGADDYITKPFSVKILMAKINGILEQRKRFYKYYSGTGNSLIKKERGNADNLCKISSNDQTFLSKLKTEIENNIDNSEFQIEDLATSMHISQKVLLKKLKSLTGLTSVEFIREIRINYAANLLESDDYIIKEIAYMTGFSDVKYFTKCFKKVFNMTPSQYKDHIKKN